MGLEGLVSKRRDRAYRAGRCPALDQDLKPEQPGDEAGLRDRVAMTECPQKITFAEMRDMDVRGILIYCADYRCSRYHSAASKLVSYFLCSVRLRTSKITAVDQPNNSTPFIDVIGPIKRHLGTGRMSPYPSVV
jgi:hypothetical protein